MNWVDDWIWGIPLIVIMVMGHSIALFGMRNFMVKTLASYYDEDRPSFPFALIMGFNVLFVTLLIAGEAAIWAAVFVAIDAQSNAQNAMLYSLEAMTTFGHADVYLAPHWQFLGALEALNGVIVIGMSTAFIYSLLRGAELRKKETR